MKTFFINEAFCKGVEDYLKSKSNVDGKLFNSFLVVVIRSLCSIYSELDIINPYQIKSEDALFDNLGKYGFKRDDINNFFKYLDGFMFIEKRNMTSVKREVNPYFISVQKCLFTIRSKFCSFRFCS